MNGLTTAQLKLQFRRCCPWWRRRHSLPPQCDQPLVGFLNTWSASLQRHLSLPLVIERYRLFGPWTRTQCSLWVVQIAANTCCCTFGISNAKEASARAEQQSLISLVPAYFDANFVFICTILGILLHLYRLFHASTGVRSLVLALLHVLVRALGQLSAMKK